MLFIVVLYKVCVFVKMSGSLMVSVLDFRLKKFGFEFCLGLMFYMFLGNMIYFLSVFY